MAVGSGSVISTAHDLNRFYAALLGGRLLAPAQLDEMTTSVNAPELGVEYGLGLAEIPLSCGGSYFGHRGELLGYITWGGATRDGTRTAVVYVTSDGGQGHRGGHDHTRGPGTVPGPLTPHGGAGSRSDLPGSRGLAPHLAALSS